MGKPAIAARKNSDATHVDHTESNSHSIQVSGLSPHPSSSTVPFKDVTGIPGHGETNEDGEFIGGVTVTKWEFGKVKAEVRTAFREKYFFGIFLSYPGDYPDGRINQKPSLHSIPFNTVEEANLSGIQQIRAEISLLVPEMKFATYALALIEKQIDDMVKDEPASEPAPTEKTEETERHEQEPLAIQTPLEILLEIQGPLQRKLCEAARYDTLSIIVKLLKGKCTPLDVSKYIMGVTD